MKDLFGHTQPAKKQRPPIRHLVPPWLVRELTELGVAEGAAKQMHLRQAYKVRDDLRKKKGRMVETPTIPDMPPSRVGSASNPERQFGCEALKELLARPECDPFLLAGEVAASVYLLTNDELRRLAGYMAAKLEVGHGWGPAQDVHSRSDSGGRIDGGPGHADETPVRPGEPEGGESGAAVQGTGKRPA